jgi:hypothetical protein
MKFNMDPSVSVVREPYRANSACQCNHLNVSLMEALPDME